jgi:hypothetical protein
MSMLDFDLFVIGMMLFGLAFLTFAAFAGPARVRTFSGPDRQDAPIFVRRPRARATTTVATRSGTESAA